uniref:Putative senescence-associated protein n=1 Tax=Pisum sativum TaxID=3888 RepID=Q9AVH7_PEA|nr:putative senescence-associated protein [Pisum sativum]
MHDIEYTHNSQSRIQHTGAVQILHIIVFIHIIWSFIFLHILSLRVGENWINSFECTSSENHPCTSHSVCARCSCNVCCSYHLGCMVPVFY